MGPMVIDDQPGCWNCFTTGSPRMDVVVDVDGAECLKLTLDPELDAVVLDVGVLADAPPDCAD